ncbi:MAG TPA: sigma 54-interacting transcriptional regulator [Terriglobales bacterium]|nr:sigma 54-interacting transcriptional regulator [Terriglobales bacterium]
MQFICATEDAGGWERRWGSASSPEATEWLRKFLEAPNIGFAVCDEELRYVFINDTLAKMNGLPAEAHLGRTVHDILGEAAENLVPMLQHVFFTGQAVDYELTAKLPTRTGVGYWTDSFFPIKDAHGKVRWVGAVVVEVTDQKKLEERLTERIERSEALLAFSTSLMSTLDEQELLPVISAFVRKVVRHDFASIALYDESIRRLRIHLLDSPLASQLTDRDTVAPTEAPYAAAFLHGEVRFHNRDELLDSDGPLLKQLLSAGIQSVCCLPLIAGKKGTLGTLNLGRKEDNTFDPQDIAFLKQVAAQVALALDNAAVYREIEELTEKLNKEKLYLQEEVQSAHDFEDLVGESPALRRVLAQLHTVAPSDATVLILGETGTGKELIARAIHRLSSRKNANFIKLNCAAIPTGLLESELFGHEKGAFTGAISQKIGRLELADKGTLFLDEVGEIPLELQPKLLRVLQDQEFERLGSTRTIKVDIRLIAATNRDLAQSVSKHEFRSDLFYRLHVFPLRMPPLRERSKDIPLLVRYFVQKFAKRMNRRIETIPAEAMHALQSWAWPGNVRELENFIERSVILSQGPTLSVPLAELQAEHHSAQQDSTLESLEREHILRVLRETGGVIAGLHGAAARLGMKRTTLQSRMQKLGITREEYQN